MATTYRYDHMHLRSRDVKKTAEYYERVFGAEIVESIQSDGRPRTDLDLNGLTIFIAPVAADAAIPSAPSEPYIGLDHFGLRVDNMDEAVTVDYLMDNVWIVGDPSECVDKIQQIYEESGGFGALLSITTDSDDSAWDHESLRLLMEEVAPRVAHLA